MAALGPCPVTGEASCYCGDDSVVRSDGTSSRHQAVLLSEVSGGLPGATLTVALSPALGADATEVVSVMLRTTIDGASFDESDHVRIETVRGDGSAEVLDKLSYSFADAVFVSATTGYRIDNVGTVLDYDIGGSGSVALRISAGDRDAGDLLEIGTVDLTSYAAKPIDEAKALMHSPAQSTQSDVEGIGDLQDLTGGGSVTLAEAIASQGGHSGQGVHAEDAAKAAEHDELLGLFPDAADPDVAVALNGGSWFDPGTWSTGAVPGDGVDVYIPLGVSVVLDGVSEARLDTVAVDGELHFAVDTDTRLVLDSLLTGSRSVLTIGTKANPVQSDVRAEIIIHADGGPVTSAANIAEDPSFLGHGVVSHGVVRIVGEDKADFLKAAVHPEAGDSALVFAEVPEGWRIGDKLVVAAAANQMNQRAQQIEIYEDEVVTIKAITANADGTYTVELDQVLQYDHAPPQHQSDAVLQIPVANYTRNVFIGSETEADAYLGNGLSVPVEERGHVMFMHNSDVEVLNAEFFELGRTDKSILIKKAVDTLRDKLAAGEIRDNFVDDVEDFLATEAAPSAHNVGGRYALHFHRTGTDDLDNPAIAEGNAIWGSPGWGMVHHDANVNMFSNAIFGTVGSGMVAEAGNEAGIWADNIVIRTTGEVITFNAESSGYPFHPDYVSDTLDDTFRQGEAFAMKSRLLEISDNVAASANGAGFSFWPHGVSGPSHINSGVDAFVHANGFDPFYGQDDEAVAKVPTRDFSGNEVIGSRHALNTSSNKTPHRHDMDVLIEDLLAWNVDQAIMSFYQQNYIIKDSIFIKGTGNAEQFQFGGFIGENGSATHIHDAVDFKLINNYWEGWDVVVREPIEIITGNTVVGSTITEQTGPDGIFREGFTADNDTIDYLDNAPGWETRTPNPVGTIEASIDLAMSDLVLTNAYDRFSLFIIKTDTIGTETRALGSQREKEFRGADLDFWRENAVNKGYYERDGKIFVVVEGVVGDRVTGSIGAINAAIELQFLEGDPSELPDEAVSNGALPDYFDENGIGEFRVFDQRVIGASGNQLVEPPVGNAAPVASEDTGFSVEAGHSIDIAVADLLANDEDPDGDLLNVSAVANGPNSTVTLNANGTVSFAPDAGYEGSESFTYTLVDGNGGSDTAEVSVNVLPPSGQDLMGDENANTLEGSSGNDSLSGFGGNDVLAGRAGDDLVDGGLGDDSADGGAGVDTLSFASMTWSGHDLAGSALGVIVDLARQGQAQDTGQGMDTFTAFENLEGSDFNDALFGDDQDNAIEGGDGRDFVTGEAGNDTLFGGADIDVLDGGAGADVLYGGTTGNGAIETDLAAYFGADGPLTFVFGTSFSELKAGSSAQIIDDLIGGDIEGVAGADAFSNMFDARDIASMTFLMGGREADTMLGGSGTDQLLGLGGADVMYGNDGQDGLIGEGGDDQFYGGAGADFIFLDGVNEGDDTIHDLELGVDVIQFTGDNVTTVRFEDVDAGGTDAADTLLTYQVNGVNAGTITIIDHDAAAVEAGLSILGL